MTKVTATTTSTFRSTKNSISSCCTICSASPAPVASGDLAVCWNLLEVSFTPVEGGQVRKHAGNVLTALRRESDGKWRIWRDANLLTPA